MKQTILIIFILISIQGFSQTELARINDSDGFVNVRVDKNTDSDIITTIKDGQFFLCEPTSENWWKIDNFYGKCGFVHESRITLIEKLADSEKRDIIFKTISGLRDYRQNYDSMRLILPTEERLTILREFENFEETVYTPLLSFLSELFCKNKDLELFDSFLKIMIDNQMSANEMPAWTLGDCYLCHPDLVLKQIDKFKYKEKDYLKNMLTFGFENVTWQKESEIDKYQELKNKLNQ